MGGHPGQSTERAVTMLAGLAARGGSFNVVSLGCSKNQVDTEFVVALLEDAGLRFTDGTFDCDLVVVNTCAFLEAARREAVDTILEYAQWKAESPSRRLMVCGCLVQRYGASRLERLLPEVDLWVPDQEELASLLERARGDGGRPASSSPDATLWWGCGLPSRARLLSPPASAYLKISEGCSNRCNYCSIPLIKGPYRSRPLREIVDEAARLTGLGVKELVLVSQDTASYGSDLDGGEGGLQGLVESLLEETEAEWIRVMYSYPLRLDRSFFRLMEEEPRVCPYLDVPVQHASDKVLEAMGRRGTRRELSEYFAMIREAAPSVVLRTTFIVGHPGEGPREFEELLDFVDEVGFEWVGVFAYSPEEGTISARRRDRARSATVARRVELLEAHYRESRRMEALGLGCVRRMLVEEADEAGLLVTGRRATEAPEVDGVVRVRWDADAGGAVAAGSEAESASLPEPGSFVEVVAREVRGGDFMAVPAPGCVQAGGEPAPSVGRRARV